MHFEAGGDFGCRTLAAKRGKGYLRLEFGAVGFACAFGHECFH